MGIEKGIDLLVMFSVRAQTNQEVYPCISITLKTRNGKNQKYKVSDVGSFYEGYWGN